MDSVSALYVSVIIPVFNDAQRLRICLQALEDQTYPKNSYEVIVVDNGSNESVEPVVAGFGQVLVAYEDRLGSYAARNRGLSLARGEVIAFTDSDCIPAPDWIEEGVKALAEAPNCGLVAGRIEVFPKNHQRRTPTEMYESITAFQQKRNVEEAKFGVTANLFTRRSIFEDVGLFDSELRSGGDREWGQRVSSHGYAQIYSEKACIHHPARHSFGELHTKILRVTEGVHELRRQDNYFWGFEKEFFRTLIPPIKSTARILSNSDLGGILNRVKVVIVFFSVRYLQVWERLRLRLRTKSNS